MKRLILLMLFLFPFNVFAAEASLFFSSRAGIKLSVRDFPARLVINSGGGIGINAAEGKIKFNPEELKVKKILKDESIFSLWTEEPKFSNKTGEITFGGGTPKPFKDTAGVVFTVFFTPQKSGIAGVDLASSTILTADGRPTNILKETDGGSYLIGNSAKYNEGESLRKKLTGRILLEVEKDGRSWYVYPQDKKRYYMGRPHDAFNLMRKLGLGVSHKYVTQYLNGAFPSAVSGKILLDVEDSGKAYYISPLDRKAYYLGRPADAFQVMRKLGLGINSETIRKIPDWAI